jgi:hypothetical protein
MGIPEPSPEVALASSQPRERQRRSQAPGDRQAARAIAASQASLNEIVAAIIRGAPGDSDLITRAIQALREHNWVSGFAFEGVWAPGWPPSPRGDIAILATRGIELKKEADAARARAAAYTYKHDMPHEAAALARRPGFRADEAALVYLVTHDAYGAAKVGVTDASGSRLAQHRREGWQIMAAFQVTAKAAIAIETDILRWWRGELGLPSYLRRDQMPQGGWTETVATGSIDLAATVTRICNLAVSAPKGHPPQLKPERVSPACGRQAS